MTSSCFKMFTSFLVIHFFSYLRKPLSHLDVSYSLDHGTYLFTFYLFLLLKVYGGVISIISQESTINTYFALVIYEANFEGNQATELGGAVYIYDSQESNKTITFYDVTFTNNEATIGGGAYFKETNVLCSNCDFERNSATNYGGAVALSSDLCHGNVSDAVDPVFYPLLQLQDDSTVLNNSALMGGGLALMCYRLYSDEVEYDSNGVTNYTYRGGAILGTLSLDSLLVAMVTKVLQVFLVGSCQIVS